MKFNARTYSLHSKDDVWQQVAMNHPDTGCLYSYSPSCPPIHIVWISAAGRISIDHHGTIVKLASNPFLRLFPERSRRGGSKGKGVQMEKLTLFSLAFLENFSIWLH